MITKGVEALKEHFKNSKFPCDVDEYMPVVFSPPRDGRQLTEPVPITGRSTSTSPPLVLSSSPPAEVSSKENHYCSENDEMDGGDHSQVNEVVNGHIVNDDVDGDDDHEMYSCVGRNRSCSSSSNGGADSGDHLYDDSDDVYDGRDK